jgi:flagellar hook protein FlgE
MSSIYTAASALRNHQTYMNVVANNIANMNTIGFKSSSITFQDLLSRTLRNGAEPAENRGGINPTQFGLGMQLGSINNNMTQGTLQATGRVQDLAITGSGFFVYAGAQQPIYSRDGALGVDTEGGIVNLSTGLRVQGWQGDEDGVINTAGQIGDIEIPIGAPMAAVATETVNIAGNIDAALDVGETVATSVQFYDSLGGLHTLELSFTKNDDNRWTVSLTNPPTETEVTLGAPIPATIQFNERGELIVPANGNITFTGAMTNGSNDVEIALAIGNVTQLEAPGNNRLYTTSQDGRAAGQMIDFTIDDTGRIIGIFSNGLLRTIGQFAIAEFVNPAGLNKAGQNGWTLSGNSGDPQIVTAGDRSQITAGFLEMSNVDLTLEFSEMIRAQRGFQANSRVITSSDQMIQELVNLVR